jgi:uncharacterized cofD-like protein
VLGGGTGLSSLLRGLKKYTSNITAIVAVTDDGGSSGTLRRELGVLPPGDIRNCLVALSEQENLMSQLFQYRFPAAGSLAGHSFGNLFITAMSSLAGGFDRGIAYASKVLAICGEVLPVTLSPVTLQAILTDGKIVDGESNIAHSSTKIREICIRPGPPPAGPRVLEAIKNADAIVIGPGSLYTSIIANFLVRGIVPALRRATVPRIYVANIMTQPGETSDYSLSDHVRALEQHAQGPVVDYIVANTGKLSAAVTRRYTRQKSYPVVVNMSSGSGVKVVKANLVSPVEYARHDSASLAATIFSIISKNSKAVHARAR